jgi:hypothetical protein
MVGLAAHVHDERDPVLAQQVNKNRRVVVAMADGVNHKVWGHDRLYPPGKSIAKSAQMTNGKSPATVA